jgi:predicted transcriptional regulator
MPIGVVSDDEFEKELSSLSNQNVVPSTSPIIGEVVDTPSKGRASGDMNVPDSLRQIIGEEAVINGRKSALGLAGMFGISPSSVSAYANGATSTKSYDTASPSISSHISKSRERAIKRASKVLSSSLNAITQDKLDYTDAKDLSAIAKDMSVVIKNLEPEKVLPTNDGQPTTQFIVYAPQFRREESFEVINVTDSE